MEKSPPPPSATCWKGFGNQIKYRFDGFVIRNSSKFSRGPTEIDLNGFINTFEDVAVTILILLWVYCYHQQHHSTCPSHPLSPFPSTFPFPFPSPLSYFFPSSYRLVCCHRTSLSLWMTSVAFLETLISAVNEYAAGRKLGHYKTVAVQE